jgi:hypothetical protein
MIEFNKNENENADNLNGYAVKSIDNKSAELSN